MNNVYLIDGVRTPSGRHGGNLADVRADDLAAITIQSIVERNNIPVDAIDDVIIGCANQAGEDNRNVARMASLLAGLPYSVPGVTVNRLCGSGLEAIIQAARAIRAGEGDIFIAGGVESMTRAPYSLPKYSKGAARGNQTAYDTSLGWRYPNSKMAERFPLEAMFETAENLAQKYSISRESQDEYALECHNKAIQAVDKGHFDHEIKPVEIKGRKGKINRVEIDEGPRRDSSLEKLAKLRPLISLSPMNRGGGSITAGNSSSLNDGSAAVLVASEKGLAMLNASPVLRFLSSGVAGVDPRIMGIGPAPASLKALKRADKKLSDLHHIEINEAFAAQTLAVLKELNIDKEKVNPLGGAIALGHPLGCSGARIVTTMLHSLKREGGGLGLASLCIGVGQGIAAVFESV